MALSHLAHLRGNQQGCPYLSASWMVLWASSRCFMPTRLVAHCCKMCFFSMLMASISVQACSGESRLCGRWSHVIKLRSPKRTLKSPELPKSPFSVTLAFLYMQQQKDTHEIKHGSKGPSNTYLSLEPQPWHGNDNSTHMLWPSDRRDGACRPSMLLAQPQVLGLMTVLMCHSRGITALLAVWPHADSWKGHGVGAGWGPH